MNNYHKAYVEVLEILKYIPKEDFNKIPMEIIETFEKNAERGYVFKINKDISFEKQNLMKETKDILAVLFRDYWATDYQKNQIKIKEKQDEYEEEKNKIKINYDEVFKKSEIQQQLTIMEEKKWYEKFLDYIKKFFKKKN